MTHRFRLLASSALALLLLTAAPALAAFELLHEFGPEFGLFAQSGLTINGSTLYGTTLAGGTSGGTVFKIEADGSGYAVITDIPNTDGQTPAAGVVVDGSSIYGANFGAELTTYGSLFQVNHDGSNYTVLRSFVGGANDGGDPISTLTLDGATLYGTTISGGSSGRGTLFRIGTDGSNFTLMHTFNGGANNGSTPGAPLVLSGNVLYGTTEGGGNSNVGTIFKINTDGTGFQLLRKFAGGASDGSGPYAGLTLRGDTLYGTTTRGGDSNRGTVFKMETDGTGFQLLHEFAGGASDGQSPSAAVTLYGNTLYGTTFKGGDTDLGTVFKINTDGTGYEVVHEFVGGENDGDSPLSPLAIRGSILYGTTQFGGDFDGGVVYSIDGLVNAVTGDYSQDGTVDPGDYTLWQSFFGSQNDLQADANYNNVIDAADYVVWRNAVSTAASGTSLPEPSTLWMTLVATLGFIVPRIR